MTADNKMVPHWHCELHDLVMPNGTKCQFCERDREKESVKRMAEEAEEAERAAAEEEIDRLMNLDARKFFVSYFWARQYCGTYSSDSGFGNCYLLLDDGNLTEEVIQKAHEDIKPRHLPFGSKLVAEVGKGSGVKIDITILNIVEVEL